MAKFAAGIVDTGGKFATSVVDTGGNFAAGVVNSGGQPLAANISANLRKNSKTGPNGILRSLGETDS